MLKKLGYIGFAYSLGSFGVGCSGAGECYDINGRIISPGFHFVPGPDTCTLCVCDNGNPKWCKAVLCSPPQDCKSFRVGNSCCEFICLDDTFGGKGGEAADLLASEYGLRLIGGAITIILCLSFVCFSVHRIRQRKITGRQQQMHEHGDHHQLAGGGGSEPRGFLAAAAGGGFRYADCDAEEDPRPPHYSLWKPAAYSLPPRGQEAPPPYEEAVAAAQVEAALAALAAAANTSGPSLLHSEHHRTIPLTLVTSEWPPSGQAPPLQSHRVDMPPIQGADQPLVAPPHRVNAPQISRVAPQRHNVATSTTTSVVAPPALPPPSQATTKVAPPVLPPPSQATAKVAPLHRVNAPQATRVAPQPPPHSTRMAPQRHNVATSTVTPVVAPPRSSSIATQAVPVAILPPPPQSPRGDVVSKQAPQVVTTTRGHATAHATAHASCATTRPHHLTNAVAMTSIAEEEQDLPGEEEEEEEEEEDDEEDYRSECENCNLSVSGGMNDPDCFVDDLETMTLHRKLQQTDHCGHLAMPMHQRRLGGIQPGGVNATGAIGEWTSLTLPTQRPTSVLCNSSQTSARENWFSSMPQSSSESSEEEEEE
ncbi:uncharacterized protein LOC111061103 [Nilaparvata lugens]|uniref:uncharacterized protein LOC111061103 n=1 Tax=Nilaparvata lugens TaxID=108931 RepID=UPI00193D89DA|nr:uncharacterized protein LOC111061103 [Nilaparvata lugens]